MGGCQNYGPFLGPHNLIFRYPKRDHNFDNHPYFGYTRAVQVKGYLGWAILVLGIRRHSPMSPSRGITVSRLAATGCCSRGDCRVQKGGGMEVFLLQH